MPDGTLAHLKLAEREGFEPPCPFGLRFSRPTHLPILPPLQMVAREGVAPPSLGYWPCILLLHHFAIEIGRNWETRTPDILLPKQTHYLTVQSSVEIDIDLVLSVIKD